MVILRMLEREGLSDHVIVVTRWYGGKHLGGDRFRHVARWIRWRPDRDPRTCDYQQLDRPIGYDLGRLLGT